MVSFDVFQDAADHHATRASESDHHAQAPRSPVETPLERPLSVLAESDVAVILRRSQSELEKSDPASVIGSYDSKDRVIVKLQRTLTDLQTATKSKQLELRGAQQDLLNARDALNKALAGQISLKQEMKTMKQTLGREHQAIVYRKDIELFALRKGNEQKEKYMRERDARLDEAFRQQHTALELKEAQLAMLKGRLELAERQASPRFSHENWAEDHPDGDHALEVRLLRVRKGRKFSGTDDEKDAIIAKLQQDLAVATKAADDVVNQQAELQRAWEINKKIQTALKEERERHDQTKLHLEEAAVKLEEDAQKMSRRNSSGRLSTIEEQDQNELEAMFDTAQQENHRLNVQVEALEKRVRDANARVFSAEQEVTALRDQIQLEKAINSDLATARPSVVHRVHFQRMEGQLKETRETLAKKEEDVLRFKGILAEKSSQLEALQKEAKRERRKSSNAKDEVDRLRRTVADLENTKERLMQDQERSASHRTRQRVPSTEYTSARCSGATLVTEQSPPPLTQSLDDIEPVPAIPLLSGSTARPVSLQEVPRRHIRKISNTTSITTSNTNMDSTIANKESSSDLKQARRKSLGFRDMMKRIVKKETSSESMPECPRVPEMAKEKPRTSSKSHNVPLTSAVPSMAKTHSTAQRPQTAIKDRLQTSNNDRPETASKDRPKTATVQDHNPFLRPRSFMNNSTPRSQFANLDTSPIPPTRFPSRKELDTEQNRPRTATLPNTLRPTAPRRLSQPRYYASPPLEEAERPNTAAVAAIAAIAAADESSKRRRKHDSGVDMVDAEKMRPLSRLSWGSTSKLKRRSLY